MNEADFAFRIRQALNEGADRIDYKTQLRLQQARQAALARFDATHAAAPVAQAPGRARLAGAGGESLGFGGWFQRLGLVVPLVALVVGFVGIAEWREAQRISYLADLDFAVLLDDGPIEAYADQGFGAFIQQEQEQ